MARVTVSNPQSLRERMKALTRDADGPRGGLCPLFEEFMAYTTRFGRLQNPSWVFWPPPDRPLMGERKYRMTGSSSI